MPPELALGPITKSVYVVTRWVRPGVAGTKYDVTEQFREIIEQLGFNTLERAAREVAACIEDHSMEHIAFKICGLPELQAALKEIQ